MSKMKDKIIEGGIVAVLVQVDYSNWNMASNMPIEIHISEKC